MRFIYLSKRITSNLELDNNVIGAYVALRSLYTSEKEVMYVSDNMLCYELTGGKPFTRYFKEDIRAGLNVLIANDLVKVIETVSKTEYILDLSGLYVSSVKATDEGDYFTIVYPDEMYKIFNLDGKTDKFALCRYFIQMLGTINFNEGIYVGSGGGTEMISNFVGYMTSEYLAKITGISNDIGLNYTSILEELELVYVYRHDKYIHKDGTIKSFTNHYGRYEDAEHIVQFAKEYEEKSGVESESTIAAKKNANTKRGLAQKYNCFYNGHQYDIDTIKEIYDYVVAYNQSLLNAVKDTTNEEYKESVLCKYKSEECFAPYLDEDGNWVGEKMESYSGDSSAEVTDIDLDDMFETEVVEEEESTYEPLQVFIKHAPKKEQSKPIVPVTELIARKIDRMIKEDDSITDGYLKAMIQMEFTGVSGDIIDKCIKQARMFAQWN